MKISLLVSHLWRWKCHLPVSSHLGFTSHFQQTFPSVSFAKDRKGNNHRRKTVRQTSLANWHFAHFSMTQTSQFYFHLVWYFCDILTAKCQSIFNKFYYEFFNTFERAGIGNYYLFAYLSETSNRAQHSYPQKDITIDVHCLKLWSKPRRGIFVMSSLRILRWSGGQLRTLNSSCYNKSIVYEKN